VAIFHLRILKIKFDLDSHDLVLGDSQVRGPLLLFDNLIGFVSQSPGRGL